MKYLLVIIGISLFTISWGQEYTLTAFQSEYVEIDDYNSLQVENLGDISQSKVFNLDFSFPYFDKFYDAFELSNQGIISFSDEDDFSIRLLTYGYDWDAVVDINSIPSDIRYKYTLIDGLQVLIIQFTRMRLISDTSIDEHDSHINFQYRIYEDGTIELVLGSYSLDNSPVYVPGEGFYLLSNQGPIPVGPELALYHPTDINRRYSYEDMEGYEDFTLRADDLGSLDWMPPSGWVFRFSKLLVNTKDISSNDNIILYPNPVEETFKIKSSERVKEILIFNIQGDLVLKSIDTYQVNMSQMKSGVYIVAILTGNKIEKYKIMKI